MTVASRAVTSSVVSFTKHTQPGKFTPQRETKNVWPTEPHKSITDWNVESQGAKNNTEELKILSITSKCQCQVLIIQTTFGLSL